MYPGASEEIGDGDVTRTTVVPSTLPFESSSLRDYVNESETLNKLVQLGTSIWRCLTSHTCF